MPSSFDAGDAWWQNPWLLYGTPASPFPNNAFYPGGVYGGITPPDQPLQAAVDFWFGGGSAPNGAAADPSLASWAPASSAPSTLTGTTSSTESDHPFSWADPYLNSSSASGSFPNAPAPFAQTFPSSIAWAPPIFPDANGQFPQPSVPPLRLPYSAAAGGMWSELAKQLEEREQANGLPTDGFLGVFAKPPPAAPTPFSPDGPSILSAFADPPAGTNTATSNTAQPDLTGIGRGGLWFPTDPPTSALDATAVPGPLAQSLPSDQPPAKLDLGANTGGPNPDQTTRSLVELGLPLSKAGVPFAPPTSPLLGMQAQAQYGAQLLAPNIYGYFFDNTPPPLTANTAGKYPTIDYGPGAVIEAGSFLLPGLEGAVGITQHAGEGALGAAARAASEALPNRVAAPVLDRAALLRLNAELGRAGEEAVGIPTNAPKTSIRIIGSGVTRYPDRLTESTLEEVKNVKHLALTQQLRDYLDHAQRNDLTFILHARPDTTYSGPLQQLIDAGQIKLRCIPRPPR